MAIKKIIKYPTSSLQKKCRPVEWPDPQWSPEFLAEHLNDLHDTLVATSNGLALASNQILADGLRLFVVKPGTTKLPLQLFNPIWWWNEPEQLAVNEGCLSFPNVWTKILRMQRITVRFQDTHGELHEIKEVSGLDAQIVQHEVDHLNGRILIDYMTKDRRVRVLMDAIRDRKTGK